MHIKTKIVQPISSNLWPQVQKVFIDAGIGTIRLHFCDGCNNDLAQRHLDSHADLGRSLERIGLHRLNASAPIFLTGRLKDVVQQHLGRGFMVLSAAALWAAAINLPGPRPLVVAEISASGFIVIGINPDGSLKDDLLTANANCGAGSGINLDRVIQKLSIPRGQVDSLLESYLGALGRDRRRQVAVRADRCGVFSSSATVSDKNQGIPVDIALAVTMKSEVEKACERIPQGYGTVWLTGGVFAWQFARECALDLLMAKGVRQVAHDRRGSLPVEGLKHLEATIGARHFIQPIRKALPVKRLPQYPAFARVEKNLRRKHLYHRAADPPGKKPIDQPVPDRPVLLGLDVGSTMAKLVISDESGQKVLFQGAYSNAGDTIETLKAIFGELRDHRITTLNVCRFGITGSARYQVRAALIHVYPQLADRVQVAVENYAHARGSIPFVHDHINRLKASGVKAIDEKFCILVDVGGEDTKITTIALDKAALFDNAMNLKCSAGTGSLLDMMTTLFQVEDIREIVRMAYHAPRGYAINATCAVYLMTHALRLQAQGHTRDEILASSVWAIAENMARTLWRQIELPSHAVVLLHGQTMLGAPMALATAATLQDHIGAAAYCLVPPDPGHRACFGMLQMLLDSNPTSAIPIRLETLLHKTYRKRMIQCRGTACGDTRARCNRTRLTGIDEMGKPFGFTLGGCSAINEPGSSHPSGSHALVDPYKKIWEFIDQALPRSDDPKRLVIPRSFCVSEWALFFSRLFTPLGIPVHVDNVIARDIHVAQPHFRIDTCAPHMGSVGQMLRLSKAPHGIILAPQIEFLPLDGNSLGRTCTVNQGGFAVAKKLAEGATNPLARIMLFHLDLRDPEGDALVRNLYLRLQSVYRQYGLDIGLKKFGAVIRAALRAQQALKTDANDLAADLAGGALDQGRRIALVLGREYILNPGIFDSHVGRLLSDKGLIGIPGHILNIRCDADLEHLYWRNAHIAASLAKAASKGQLHRIVRHPRMQQVFARIEKGPQRFVPLVRVSAFQCGPDSVTGPLIDDLTRKRPCLNIQTDAVVKELAHLENRLNTYVQQLQSGLHAELATPDAAGFEVKSLDLFVNRESLSNLTDVIYLPTLADNRLVTAVVRAAGFTCIDIYDDRYDLSATIKRGRSVTGDAVCAPLAAVYGDILKALTDFKDRKKAGDPRFKDKTRLLVFNNKGLGPCRQGQYVEMHKLFLNRGKGACAWNSSEPPPSGESLLKFLVGRENQGFNIGLPQWAYLRGIQAVILQGVLHQILSHGASQCRDMNQYERFLSDYARLKKELALVLERNSRPSEKDLKRLQRFTRRPILSWVFKYFAYGFHETRLLRPLRGFARKWLCRPLDSNCLRIHIDGEVYMRTAQFEEIHRHLIAGQGFRQFQLTYTPLWSFLEYKLSGMLMRGAEAIQERTAIIQREDSPQRRAQHKTFIQKKQRRLIEVRAAYLLLRYGLAWPLYRAAGLTLPEAVPKMLSAARKVIPTRRPGGELVPYIGEALLKLGKGYDLILNVAPEGCMVSSMGEILGPVIIKSVPDAAGKIQPLFSQHGDVNEANLAVALLKSCGPFRLYRAQNT